jgi:CubicO group peptidase (beta-lactamase class C family)
MIIITKDRRDFLRQGAAALAGAASWAALPSRAAGVDRSAAADPKAHRVSRGRFKAIDDALAQGVATGTVAAAVGLAADTHGVFYEGAYGKRDLGGQQGVDQDTVFWLLSMTKAITAAACMQLVEQGKLSLDEPASKVLPELASPKVLEGFDDTGKPILRPAKRAITLRHLLTHTSGYTYANWSDKLPQYEKVTGQPDIAYSLNGAFAAPLEFDPGERWQYGIGMDVVGKLIEAVSGQSLEIYFRDHLFEPLGMANTGFLINGAQKRRTATTYQRQADGSLQAMPFEMNQRPEFFSGGGGLFGTPRDYMAFLQMLVKDGTHKGVRLLKPETVALMRSNAIGELQVNPLKSSAAMWSRDADLFPGMKQKWGLSFDINPEPGPNGRSAGSYAWAGLLNCYYWVDPVKKVTGAVFTQLLPFYDARMVELFGAFERGVYAGLAKA